MMKNVKITLDHVSYSVEVEAGLFRRMGTMLRRRSIGNRYIIITDSKVKKLYGDQLKQQLEDEGLRVSLLFFPSGEAHKGLSTYGRLQEQLFKLGCDRKACLVALGGGVVGDVAGFVAATFMRGIAFVQIPTTLLAMVDASVGGKTGVDLAQGKNIVGAFHQPRAVYIDPVLLRSLSKDEMRNGLVECVKHGCIGDVSLLTFIEKNLKGILAHDAGLLEDLIVRNCSLKADIVMRDEREAGIRKLLNYGHTLGHALEVSLGYGTIAHGRAVAVGMRFAGKLSVLYGSLSQQACDRQNALLDALGCTDTIAGVSSETLVSLMRKDKKIEDGVLGFVLLDALGKATSGVVIAERAVVEVLEGMM